MVESDRARAGGGFPRLVELDGWRGVSILFVVIGHLLNRRYSSHPDIDLPNLPGVLSTWGVSIFFVISGFIITNLALAERENSGTFSTRAFYIRRFFRIVPPFYAYLVATGLAGAAGLIDQPIWWTAAAASFICNLHITSCGWFAGHSWTLAFEEQFYLSFPLVFWLSGISPKRIFLALFFFLILFPFFRYVAHLDGLWHSAAGLMRSFSFICIGAVAATYERRLKHVIAGRFAPYFFVFAGLCLCGLAAFNSIFSFALSSREAYFQVAINSLLLPPLLVCVILITVYRWTPFSWLLKSRFFQFLGAISYSLYLWQAMFTAKPSLYLVDSPLTFPMLMLVAATASYYWIEKPCIRFGKRLLTSMREAAPMRESLSQLSPAGNSLSAGPLGGEQGRSRSIEIT